MRPQCRTDQQRAGSALTGLPLQEQSGSLRARRPGRLSSSTRNAQRSLAGLVAGNVGYVGKAWQNGSHAARRPMGLQPTSRAQGGHPHTEASLIRGKPACMQVRTHAEDPGGELAAASRRRAAAAQQGPPARQASAGAGRLQREGAGHRGHFHRV